MSKALEELRNSLAELEADLGFVSLATRLRPRLGEIVNWDAAREVVELARKFMSARDARAEGLFGPLLVRLLASLERYARNLVGEALAVHASRAATYDQIPPHIKTRNVALTGTLLAFTESPRDYLTIHIDTLVANLASCKSGNATYQLNAQAFAAAVTGAGAPAIEKALANVGIHDCWDRIGGDGTLAGVLGTKGARATGKQARSRLEELSRWRNHLAHGGDEEVSLTEDQLRECIAFVSAFSAALDDAALAVV